MTFNANQHPTDCQGCPIEPGEYRVARGGLVRVGTVFESDQCDLLVRFEGEERTQRVDELSQFCSWAKAEESEVAGEETA